MNARHETGFWNVPYPQPLRDSVLNTAEAWKQFCTLSSTTQDVFTATNNFNGVGFERKDGSGTNKSHLSRDKKLNFDITQSGIPTLRSRLESIDSTVDHTIAKSFIQNAEALAHLAPLAIKAFGETIEQEYNVERFAALAEKSAPNAFFRALCYPPTQAEGEVIAEPHVDNSGFTLHLFESTSGCEALDPDRTLWRPMPVAHDNAIAFPSMQTQLFSNGEVDGVCHHVVSNKTTRKYGRYAIVCFVQLHGMPAYDRAQHGRLQEKQPGFNYGMEAEAFRDLFVKDA